MITRNIIGVIIVAIGLLLAIGTMDNSGHEMICRFGGIALIAFGAWLAEAFDFQKQQ